uniref:DOG1 domain-containing protein n=1 Tax=Nymphaea colorata TaxID=210225 RepID=A0A5K1G9D4_9MAGN
MTGQVHGEEEVPPPPPYGQPPLRRFRDCHRLWIERHQLNVQELIRVHNNNREDEGVIRSTVAQVMESYRDYYRILSRLAVHNAPSVVSPARCTSEFENAYSWLGGCRPTAYLRLVYVISGLEIGAQLPDLLRLDHDVNLAGLSAHQLNSVSELQRTTVGLEDELSRRMASLQEAMADRPLVRLLVLHESQVVESAAVQSALKSYADRLHVIVEHADGLRLNTLRRVLEILSPLQGLHLLIMASRFHLRLHEWGRSWDRMHQNV